MKVKRQNLLNYFLNAASGSLSLRTKESELIEIVLETTF
jgi:hypothetical protein